MSQDKISEIIELEQKFQKLADNGHPNVVDNGFFLDAIFNVTAVLKQSSIDDALSHNDEKLSNIDDLQIIENLYNSLKDFEKLYNKSLNSSTFK